MCKNSRLIKHPHADYHLRHAEAIYINGQKSYLSDAYSVFSDISTFINQHFSTSDTSRDEICLTLCNNSYIVWKSRRFPLFLRLTCGKCDECRFLYKKEIENRALIEASESSHVFFYTLTYDDAHLPVDGLHKSDVIAAFKNLRNHIHRYLGFSVTFTQIYVGEYGTDVRHSLRPHYHGLLFVKECLTPKQINEFFDLFSIYQTYYDFHERRVSFRLGEFYSNNPRLTPWWPHGMRIDIQNSRNVSALVRYVCKYITKGFNTDFSQLLIYRERYEQHSNPLFVQLPKSRGLGCANIDAYKEKIMSSRNGCITINVHGSIERIKIPKIFISKLFPSLGTVCPNATYNYKLLRSVLDILSHRRTYLLHPYLHHTISFIELRLYPLDYLSNFTIRNSQKVHLDISLAFYREMSDFDLVEISQLIFYDLESAFDFDTFNNRALLFSDFQEESHSSCPSFDSLKIVKKLFIDTSSDLDYIDKHMNYSFYDSFV